MTFLALIPIMDEELLFMREHGVEAFLKEAELPLIYDGPRPPAVKTEASKPWWKRW